MKTSVRPVLLVEDDCVDAMAVRRALGEINVPNALVRCENGEAALDYLRNDAREKPCIILLDLNMPVMNGIEFLAAIKADERLRRLPVVVLTSSNEQQDKISTFDLSVAGYMSKPLDYRQLVEVIRSIDLYWTLSELP